MIEKESINAAPTKEIRSINIEGTEFSFKWKNYYKVNLITDESIDEPFYKKLSYHIF